MNNCKPVQLCGVEDHVDQEDQFPWSSIMEDRARINTSIEIIFRHEKKKKKRNENWERIIDIYLCFIMAMSAIENFIAARRSDLASPPVMGAPDQTQKPRF